jgi:hypothetical protein
MIIELDRPGRFEHMIEAAFAAGRDGGFDARGRMGPRAAAALVRRYPDEIAPPWRRWLQRLVIPPLALAGRRAVALLVVAAALVAFPAVASASSRPVKYAGRTSSGHPVTFKIAGGRMYELRAGVRVSCVPMQGGSTPTGGTDIFGFDGYVPLKRHVRFKFKAKTALWFNEVTKTHDIWITRRGSTIRGRLRLQFSFLVPKFTPGTFTIYSCLGGATFKARPKQ